MHRRGLQKCSVQTCHARVLWRNPHLGHRRLAHPALPLLLFLTTALTAFAHSSHGHSHGNLWDVRPWHADATPARPGPSLRRSLREAALAPPPLAKPPAASRSASECNPKQAAKFAASKGNLIINGGRLLALDKASTERSNTSILIRGGVIKQIGNKDQFSGSNVTTVLQLGDDDIIIPGLINTHTHAAMTLLRGLGNDLDLSDWLTKYIFPIEAALVDDEFIRTGVELAVAEQLATGTTTFVDMYLRQRAAAPVVERAGMRAVLGTSVIDFPTAEGKTPQEQLKSAEGFIAEFKNYSRRITPTVTPHSPYTTSAWVYREALAIAARHGVPVLSTHCSETKAENANMRNHQAAADGGLPSNVTTATDFLEYVGFLGPRTICAHSVWLTDSDVSKYSSSRTSVSTCPQSNAKLASGILKLNKLRDANVTVSVGTDGAASNNNLDLLEEVAFLSLLRKAIDMSPRALPAEAALRLATNGGAKAINRWGDLGSIEAGKLADIAVLNGGAVNLQPLYDGSLAAAAVYASTGSNIRATIVDGRVLYLDGCYSTIDWDSLAIKVARQRRRVADYLASRKKATGNAAKAPGKR